MKLSNDEKTLAMAVAIKSLVLVVGGTPLENTAVPLSELDEFFDRPCKLRKAVRSLERWQVITHDPYAATVRILLLPALRILSCGPVATQPEMFTNERPLDAALAQTCSGTFAAPAPRPPDAPRVPGHAGRVPEHNQAVSHNNVGTFNRKDVSTIKRLTCTVDELKSKVKEFVGAEDFETHWEDQSFWDDERRCSILSGTLRYLKAGLRSKEIVTKTSPGRHLWNQFRHDCRDKGIEALI